MKVSPSLPVRGNVSPSIPFNKCSPVGVCFLVAASKPTGEHFTKSSAVSARASVRPCARFCCNLFRSRHIKCFILGDSCSSTRPVGQALAASEYPEIEKQVNGKSCLQIPVASPREHVHTVGCLAALTRTSRRVHLKPLDYASTTSTLTATWGYARDLHVYVVFGAYQKECTHG